MVRAKVTLNEERRMPGNQSELVFAAVCDDSTPENERFTEYTPSGELRMHVTNPAALAQFELGKSYYLDLSPAPD